MDTENSMKNGGGMITDSSAEAGVPIRVINAVNANGIVSGQKVVSHAWKQLAVCLLIVMVGVLAGLALAIVAVSDLNVKLARLEMEKTAVSKELKTLQALVGADSQQEAIELLGDREVLNGGDLAEIRGLLVKKYGENYKLDLTKANINFVQEVGAYKYVSLGVVQAGGTVRAVMYGRVQDGKWTMSAFDSAQGEKACAEMSEEEQKILKVLSLCKETEETEAVEQEGGAEK